MTRRRKCRFYAFLFTEEKLLYGITPTLPPKGTTSGQMTILSTPAEAEVLLYVIAPPLPKKRTSALAREKLLFHSVFHGLLDYRFFSAKRSSRWSERKRSELLFEKNVRLRASFLCFTFYMRLTARVGTGEHLTHSR